MIELVFGISINSRYHNILFLFVFKIVKQSLIVIHTRVSNDVSVDTEI